MQRKNMNQWKNKVTTTNAYHIKNKKMKVFMDSVLENKNIRDISTKYMCNAHEDALQNEQLQIWIKKYIQQLVTKLYHNLI